MIKLSNLEQKKIKNFKTKFLLPDINKITNGFNENELVIISAKPKMGKTTLALDLLFDFNFQNYKTLFISCEMNTDELNRRLDIIQSYMLNDTLDKDLIYVDDSNEIDIDLIETNIKQVKPDIVFIDYIQLLRGSLKQNSKKLKLLARKYKLPIICLAQRNRNSMQIEKWIEQDADQVWFIDFDRIIEETTWKETGEPIEVYNIIITKNRKGKIGTLKTKMMKFAFWFDTFNYKQDDPHWMETLQNEEELKQLEIYEKEIDLYNRWYKYYRYKDKYNKDDVKVIIGNMVI